MAVQSGKDLLLKVDMNGDGSFETVAGLRATRVSFNAETVDVTSMESVGGWRELLAGAGVKSASISGSGVFRDANTDERARQIFFDGEVPEWQVICTICEICGRSLHSYFSLWASATRARNENARWLFCPSGVI